jgi:hypothetical protein
MTHRLVGFPGRCNQCSMVLELWHEPRRSSDRDTIGVGFYLQNQFARPLGR